MGTQPRDLLIAWLSFLAGDFCEEGKILKNNNIIITLSVASTAAIVLEKQKPF